MEKFRQLCTSPQAWLLDEGLTTQRLDASYYEPRFLADSQELDNAGYPVAMIKDLAEKSNCGATPQMVEYTDTGTILIRGANVRANYFELAGAGRVNGLKVNRDSNRAVLPGDVLYTMSGVNVGNATVYPEHGEIASFSNTVARARFATSSGVDPYFATLFLNSPHGMSQTERLTSGGVLPHVMPNSFKRLRLLLPKDQVQTAVANKVRKAERLQELARLAETRFEHWIRTATDGDTVDSEMLNLLSHVPARTRSDATWVINFDPADRVDPWPHHLAPRSIRRQLRHASARAFAEFFEVVSSQRGRANPPLAPDCFFLSILDIDTDGFINWTNAAKTRYESDGTIVLADDILYSTLNPQESRVGVIPKSRFGTIACSTEFSILRLAARAPDTPHLLAAILRSNWLRVQASFLTRSSSLSRRRLDEGDLQRLLIPWNEQEAHDLDLKLANAVCARHDSVSLVTAAKADVEALIDGTLDEQRLLEEGEETSAWLAAHPLPASERTSV